MTRNFNNETGQTIKTFVEQGLKPKEISAITGLALQTIYTYTKGIKFRKQESHNDIRELRKAGLSVFDIRTITGKDPKTISSVCRDSGLTMTEWEKQETIRRDQIRKTHTWAWVSEYISEKSEGRLEYVSGYSNMDSYVMVKCLHCGEVFRKSMGSFRSGRPLCHICHYDPVVEQRKKEREAQKQKEKELRRIEKETQLLVQFGRGRQTSFNLCGCGAIISNKATRCEDCRRAWKNKQRPSDEKWNQIRKNTDALRRIYDRDGGICYICGLPCNYDDFYYKNGAFCIGAKYPTIDHVIPRSKGGQNTFDNFKLAHMICNSLKGDSYDEGKLEKPNSKSNEGSGNLSAVI